MSQKAQVNVRITPELRELLRFLSFNEGRPEAYIIEEAIRIYTLDYLTGMVEMGDHVDEPERFELLLKLLSDACSWRFRFNPEQEQIEYLSIRQEWLPISILPIQWFYEGISTVEPAEKLME